MIALRGDRTGWLRIRALVDTGATFMVLPETTARRLGQPTRHRVRVRLADGTYRNVPMMSVFVKLDGHEAPATALVVPGGQVLLGKALREHAITLA